MFVSHVLSFVFVGIYWNNHHHLFQAAQHVNRRILWANLYLLFWLSLTPFVTRWMGESHFAPWPVALYGVVLLFTGGAYVVLIRTLISHDGKDSPLATALGRDVKSRTSLILDAMAIPLSFIHPLIACALCVLGAVLWLAPDRRIERALGRGVE